MKEEFVKVSDFDGGRFASVWCEAASLTIGLREIRG
jgi:hypothetical protein